MLNWQIYRHETYSFLGRVDIRHVFRQRNATVCRCFCVQSERHASFQISRHRKNLTRSACQWVSAVCFALCSQCYQLVWENNNFSSSAYWGFPGGSEGKASAYNAGDPGSIPGWGRSPGEGNGNPLQYSCLENPLDGEAWWTIVHGVAKGQYTTDEYVQSNMLTFLLQQTDYKGLVFMPGEQSGGWKVGGQEEMHFVIYPEGRIQSQLWRRKSELPRGVLFPCVSTDSASVVSSRAPLCTAVGPAELSRFRGRRTSKVFLGP